MSRRSKAISPVLVAVALGLAGCGSAAPKAPDPATIVPATAPLYIEADVRPQGALQSNADADGQTLSHESKPFAQLLQALSLQGPTGPVDFGEVKPWLGEDAGVFLTRIALPTLHAPSTLAGILEFALSGRLLDTLTPELPVIGGPGATSKDAGLYDSSQGAVVLDTTSVASARAFLATQAVRSHAQTSSFDGVTVDVAPSGRAGALVGAFLVIGSAKAVEEAIATARGGAAMVHLATYAELSSTAAPGALSTAYVSAQRLPRALESAGSAARATAGSSAAQLASALRKLAPAGEMYLSLTPELHSVRLDVDTTDGGAAKPPTASGSEQQAVAAQLMQALPEGAWLAGSTADLGPALSQALSLLPTLGGAAPGTGGDQGLAGLLGKGTLGSVAPTVLPSVERALSFLQAKNAKLKGQVLGALGPAALFVSGTSLPEFDAGLVIAPKNPATALVDVTEAPSLMAGSGIPVTRTPVPGTEAAVSLAFTGLPVPAQLAAEQGKLVLALGLSAVQDALTPSGTLGSSAAYKAATATLGEGMQPHLMVAFGPLVSLSQTIGLTENASIAKLLPYLKSLSTLSVGSRSLGAVTRTRILLGLH